MDADMSAAPERRPDLWETLVGDPKHFLEEEGSIDEDWTDVWDTVVEFVETPHEGCRWCYGATPLTKRLEPADFCSAGCANKYKYWDRYVVSRTEDVYTHFMASVSPRYRSAV